MPNIQAMPREIFVYAEKSARIWSVNPSAPSTTSSRDGSDMEKTRSTMDVTVSATTIFWNKPITISGHADEKKSHFQLRSDWICGKSVWGRSMGPATTCGKNETYKA